MHLVNADTNRINETMRAFKRYDIERIVPLHCTGSKAIQRLEQTFGDRVLCLGRGHVYVYKPLILFFFGDKSAITRS
jgi:7,8-dihydropterin-6-yl-methyl-4-(beta-D-ribofuranosyl)aminobenzene 5'-phosphate synthase